MSRESHSRKLDDDYAHYAVSYEIGQAPAQLYLDMRSKDRDKRWAAQAKLTERIAARFRDIEMYARAGGKPEWLDASAAATWRERAERGEDVPEQIREYLGI